MLNASDVDWDWSFSGLCNASGSACRDVWGFLCWLQRKKILKKRRSGGHMTNRTKVTKHEEFHTHKPTDRTHLYYSAPVVHSVSHGPCPGPSARPSLAELVRSHPIVLPTYVCMSCQSLSTKFVDSQTGTLAQTALWCRGNIQHTVRLNKQLINMKRLEHSQTHKAPCPKVERRNFFLGRAMARDVEVALSHSDRPHMVG